MTIKILSLDGGGIRGIIPAIILAEIEDRTKRPISSLFDLVAGTSTGGILALGLSKPENGKPRYSAGELVQFYEDKGEAIFSQSLCHEIRSLKGLIEERYPPDGIEAVLDRYFGATKLSESLTDLFITSYEIERRDPFFFRTTKARKDPAYDYLMKDVARATSAAPTYFQPAKVRSEKQAARNDRLNYYTLVDGGMFANNPSMCAFVDAKIDMFNKHDEEDLIMVSIGTGQLSRTLPYPLVQDWGILQWAKPALDVVFDGVSDTIDYQLRQLLPTDRYYRFQVSLEIMGSDDMDDTSAQNLHELKTIAEELISKEGQTLDRLCAQLL
ncbi:MAG TPA: patatin-like phospholipase family protein [Nitrospirota bacterium]|nr:patatin-like phospholipase family protein [Nitrospirota bacterium]